MKENEVRQRAFAMPLTSPAYPIGPYRFIHRESLVIVYRTDPKKLRELVPEPLQIDEPLVKFEFIRMPDSTGFGDYTESGQVIPVSFKGRKGGYTHCMFLNDHPPIAGGRELWGFPKKLAEPTLRAEIDTLVGTLDYGPVRIATGTMGYKHVTADHKAVLASLAAPNFLLKIMPHVDGTPRISHHRRSDARPRQGGARLSGLSAPLEHQSGIVRRHFDKLDEAKPVRIRELPQIRGVAHAP
jgi:acetoacetate decarboxylase